MCTIANYQKGSHYVDIKAVITDVDGCLTDNGVYYARNSEVYRKFNVLDGHAFKLLSNSNIIAAMISASDNVGIDKRAAHVGAIRGHTLWKEHWITKFAEFNDIDLTDTAFMGNDVIDLEALKIVGIAACPSDAHPEVRAYVETRLEKECKYGFVTKQKGGQAAFREFVDLLFYLEFIKA